MIADKGVLFVLGHFIGVFRFEGDLFKLMVGFQHRH